MAPVDPAAAEPLFSEREAEVLALICRGLSNPEIAAHLYLSVNSVKTYVRTGYAKIGATRRSQAILWAVEHGHADGERPWPVVVRNAVAGRPPQLRQRRPDEPPPVWNSPVLSVLRVDPARIAGDTLTELDVSHGTEALALAELGVTTLDLALATGRPEQLTDYLGHAADRFSVLQGARIEGGDLAHAVRRAVAGHARAATLESVNLMIHRALAGIRSALPAAPLGPEARAYLAEVLAGESRRATTVVLDAIAAGMDVGDVLVDVLEAAQREIGRLWQIGVVTVDQEYFCTAVTQSSMTALYPFLFTGRAPERHLVAVNAPGSLHQVGLRMVTDLLEHEGWSTTYLGSDVTIDDLPGLLVEHHATVLLISASMAGQAEAIRSMIAAVRADPRTRDVPVAVGGRAFLVAPALVETVGADGWAADARAAVSLCHRLAEAADARR